MGLIQTSSSPLTGSTHAKAAYCTNSYITATNKGARVAGDGERPIVWRINQNFSNPVHYSRERRSTFERYYTDISRMSLALHQSGLNFFFLSAYFMKYPFGAFNINLNEA